MWRLFSGIFFLSIWLLISLVDAADLADKVKVLKIRKEARFSLGVLITEVEKEQLDKYQIKGGASIMEVLEDSEAERIGLEEDDIIIRFAGQEIAAPSQIKTILNEMEEEGQVEIVVLREGERKTFQAKLFPQKAEDLSVDVEIDSLDFSGLADLPRKIFKRLPFVLTKGGFLGVKVENLNEQLADYFEVEYGVLIEEIIKDSPAEKAGLKAGDVIMEIEKKKIEDYEDLIRTVNYYDPDDTISLKYSRKGKVNSVSITLAEKDNSKSGIRVMPHGMDFRYLTPPPPPEPPDIEQQREEFRKQLKYLKKDIKMFLI